MKFLPFLLLSISCTSVFAETSAIKNESNFSIDSKITQQKVIPTAKRKVDEIPDKKAESKKSASNSISAFKSKIFKVWIPPVGAIGQTAKARIILNEDGTISLMVINSSDPDVKASIERAIRNAAPFPMPSDPDARREARRFIASFTVK